MSCAWSDLTIPLRSPLRLVTSRRPWSEGGKRTFFLVNTVPLVKQQATAIEQHTDLTVGQFTGSASLDAWERRDWEVHLEKNQVSGGGDVTPVRRVPNEFRTSFVVDHSICDEKRLSSSVLLHLFEVRGFDWLLALSR